MRSLLPLNIALGLICGVVGAGKQYFYLKNATIKHLIPLIIKFHISVYINFIHLTTGVFTASNGDRFLKASSNIDCCEKYSLSSSKSGIQSDTFVIVRKDPATRKRTLRCYNGERRTLQGYIEWTSNQSSFYKGLCIDGWVYTAEGI